MHMKLRIWFSVFCNFPRRSWRILNSSFHHAVSNTPMYLDCFGHLSQEREWITPNKGADDSWDSGAETGLCFLSCERVRPSGSDLDKAAGLSVIARVTQVNYHRCEIIARSGLSKQHHLGESQTFEPLHCWSLQGSESGKHFLSSSFSCTFFLWNFQRLWRKLKCVQGLIPCWKYILTKPELVCWS